MTYTIKNTKNLLVDGKFPKNLSNPVKKCHQRQLMECALPLLSLLNRSMTLSRTQCLTKMNKAEVQKKITKLWY